MASRLERLRRGRVSESFAFAGPSFRRAAPWLLAGVAFLALVARVAPALLHAVWGSDSGEYYYLTERLVRTGSISFDYDGWGLAYPYFPGMFVVSGATHAVLGVDLFRAGQWTVPLLAASMPVLVGLLAFRVTSDPRAAVVAGAFTAVSALVVITTSHAMPGTLGQMFLAALVALLPDAHRDRRHLALFAVLGAALLWTHHLTTYFAIGIVAFITFYREMTQRATDVQRLRVEVVVAGALLVAAAAWWLGVATPFRDEIVGDALPFHPLVTVALFLLALAFLPALVVYKRRNLEWHKGPRYPGFPAQRVAVVGTALVVWLVVLFAVTVRVPGSEIRVSPLALLYIVPVLGFVAFLPLGMDTMRFHKQSVVPIGWLYAVLASLAFAVVTGSRVFFPFRHIDYMAMAMAPLAAVGMLLVYDQVMASRVPSDRPRTRGLFVAGFALLVAVSLALSLPPRGILGGFEEGIAEEEMDAVRWVQEHPDVIPPGSTMAADHRVSSLMWGLARIHATWDYTPRTYHSENASEALDELNAVGVPAAHGEARRVDFVFLSPQIEQGVTLTQWENSSPMSAAASSKFESPDLFAKVYDERDVRIYRVLW